MERPSLRGKDRRQRVGASGGGGSGEYLGNVDLAAAKLLELGFEFADLDIFAYVANE